MSHSIGVIISSVRQPRICPQIADFVVETIQTSSSGAAAGRNKPTLKKIDLANWTLPFTGEPGIPAHIKDPSEYSHDSTREWSKEISSHDAFIFVSPQYNWGYPAALKNAIDHLYNEWVGKPAMIVTYGGYGGNKCAAQLESVLNGLRMKPATGHVELPYPGREWAASKAFKGADLELDAKSAGSLWAEHRPTIVAVFEEVVKLLAEPSGSSN